MAFSINNFRENLNVGKTNLFEVDFVFPGGISPSLVDSENLTLKCFSAEIPGVNLNTFEQTDYGLPRNIAYGKLYTESSFGLILSEDYKELKDFNRWINFIYDDFTGNVKYLFNYATTTTLRVYDPQGRIRTTVNFDESYPKTITPLQLSWEDNDTLPRATVTMAYRKYFLF
jgi:hypothetical protein